MHMPSPGSSGRALSASVHIERVKLWKMSPDLQSVPREIPRHGELLLIGVFPLDKQNSMSRYVTLLHVGLAERGYTVTEMHPVPRFGRLYQNGAMGKWLGYIDKYLIFPIELVLRGRRWKYVHICDHSSAMYLQWLRRASISITCHDLLAIHAAAGVYSHDDVGRKVSWTGKTQQAWIKKYLIRAAKVVCVSNATRRALLGLGATGRLETIHNPVVRPLARADSARVSRLRKECSLSEAPYFVHVGGNQWYKNRLGVVMLFAELRKTQLFQDYHLVLAGKEWTGSMRSACREQGLGNCVHAVVDPTDECVETLYSGAEALLFPSLAEGFGWPIIEAQSCGSLVITSNREPMVEVAGEGAIFIDPAQYDRAASTICEAWPDREAVRLRGIDNAKTFSREHFLDDIEAFLFGTPGGEPGLKRGA